MENILLIGHGRFPQSSYRNLIFNKFNHFSEISHCAEDYLEWNLFLGNCTFSRKMIFNGFKFRPKKNQFFSLFLSMGKRVPIYPSVQNPIEQRNSNGRVWKLPKCFDSGHQSAKSDSKWKMKKRNFDLIEKTIQKFNFLFSFFLSYCQVRFCSLVLTLVYSFEP